ncbi:hypothetical protein M569_00251, partial [Genlisea aurea]
LEMGAGLKKDLRVSRVGPGGSLNAFFFLLIGGSYFTKTCQGKAEEAKKHTWRAQYNGELYAAFGKDESLPNKESLDSFPIGWTVGAMIYFTGEVSGSSPGWPSCAREKNRRSI